MKRQLQDISSLLPKRLKLENCSVKLTNVNSVINNQTNGFVKNGYSLHSKDTVSDILTKNTESIDFQASPVSVDEVYQLGIENRSEHANDSCEVLLLDFVDSLQVSYPVNLSCISSELLEKIPLFFHGHVAENYLSAVASGVLRELATRLDTWMNALDKADENEFIARHLSAYYESTALRRQVFALLKFLVPDAKLSDDFDYTSTDLDRLLDRIIHDLDDTPPTNNHPNKAPLSDSFPLVSLCPDPEHCTGIFKKQILRLLHLLLPQLDLPDSFNAEHDLPSLIEAIYCYNMQCS